jgi:hypothetical protein
MRRRIGLGGSAALDSIFHGKELSLDSNTKLKEEIMRRETWIVMMACVALAGSSVLAVDLLPAKDETDTSMQAIAAPPDCGGSWRAVRLHCRGGSQGAATGSYGGSDFFLICNGDRVTTNICTSGDDYRYIMEGQFQGGSVVRCANSGSAVQVNESCGRLHLTIN